MTKGSILRKFQKEEINLEKALESLAKEGLCPAVVNDDFGNWAVSFSGYQNIPEKPGEPSDIQSSFFIEAKEWKKTIREAFIYALTAE
jgi:hypothetical protein